MGIFTIACVIGGQTFSKVIFDLGANINLTPISIFNCLEIGEIKPTIIALQMKNQLVTYPMGIVEDVILKVEGFIFPTDFVVLNMPEDKNISSFFGR